MRTHSWANFVFQCPCWGVIVTGKDRGPLRKDNTDIWEPHPFNKRGVLILWARNCKQLI